MKTRLYICLCLLLCGSIASAAVIVTPGRLFIEAAIEGDALTGQAIGETLDYLTFEVTTPTAIRLIGTNLSSTVFLALTQILVPSNEFFHVSGLYLLFYEGEQRPTPEFTRDLEPGRYAIQIAMEEYRGGDIGDTFVPVPTRRRSFRQLPTASRWKDRCRA